jgi:hypothetical protein
MSRKRYTPEQIIGMLWEAKVVWPRRDGSPGLPHLSIAESTCYRWR